MRHLKVNHRWLFRLVADGRNRSLGWAAMKGPLRSKKELEEYKSLSQYVRFFGLCGFLDWPKFDGYQEFNSEVNIEGWCHPFLFPNKYLPSDGAPRALISNSDFTDPKYIRKKLSKSPNAKAAKKYDFIVSCNDGGWLEDSKGWDLIQQVVPRLCESGLKGLMVNKELKGIKNLDCIGDYLDQPEFFSLVRQSRMFVFCNSIDASPRIIAESMILDVPILVNAEILGGWKYVNKYTGAFFRSSQDIVSKANGILDNQELRPASYFRQHYGPEKAGRRLSSFLRQIDRGFGNHPHVRLVHDARLGEKP